VISHGLAALVFLTLFLIYKNNINLSILNISATICYGLSALHHIFSANFFLTQLDYVGIYTLIAGTYFSIFRNKFLLTSIILISILFSTLQIINNKVYPPGYLLAGWLSIFGIPELLRKISKKRLTLFWVGGIMYSLGEWINLQGYHELFHVFVISGTLCHLTFVRRLSEENKVDWKNTLLHGTSRVPIGRGQLGRSDVVYSETIEINGQILNFREGDEYVEVTSK
jgi:hemolysin III